VRSRSSRLPPFTLSLVGAVLALLMLSHEVFAQEDEAPAAPAAQAKPAAGKGRKTKTAVSFDETLIEGEVKRPEFFYFLQKKQFNFGRLIKLRENFLPEARKTSEAIQRRSGSGE
jgi:hypothetical protein